MHRTTIRLKPSAARALSLLGAALLTFFSTQAMARPADAQSALIVTDDPLPASLENKVYSKPSQAPVITPAEVLGDSYYDSKGETVVGHKVDAMRAELADLQAKVGQMASALSSIENNGQNQAAAYYASVATISTQLQSGTTPGNPRLLQKFQTARNTLDQFGNNVAMLNDLSLRIANAASHSAYLLETVRATYSLSGAVEEDHVHLTRLEDSINNTNVIIDRMLNNVNDDITRTTAYLDTERDNMRTLALAIESGNMFGKSLSNRPFSNAQLASFTPVPASAYGNGMNNGMMQPPSSPSGYTSSMTPMPLPQSSPMAQQQQSSAPSSPRPLVKIRFDRPDVNYQQPLYMAVNEALKRFPDARFELVAVHPTRGNAAEVAIESTKSRRDGEKVLRSLTQMGLDLDRIDLSYSPSQTATTSEVQLYVR